ncbi:amino acid synthesis family protein [Acuticoccus mangrovi]|uniref:Amino acid synthesis family protein n=1 Tax=Acuticoccus mangrovi TaxID=2796142 RepID=A0A934IFP7_9HYPH|nr:amino acid synthesis family protein [Acuticoccus mangrovi]MBJ3774151.1 amino acid synthesis family protein [Acuticoccus mangrovi]
MALSIRRTYTFETIKREEAGIAAATPLRKLAVAVVVENAWLGEYVADLGPAIAASVELGEMIGDTARRHFAPGEVQSYGKGGIVGLAGEQEHANALLTTRFADPVREAIGGGKAWISSMTKVAAPGTLIDIPMNHKDDVYVRSHYDGMSLVLPDAPMPDEIAVIVCFATGGRLNARVGGLTHDEVMAREAAGK